jgi:enoyl-CoA hydratase/carnithine racemase
MSHVRYERDADIAEIVLASPPLNLFGPGLMEELRAAVAGVLEDRPRALLIRADGDVFTAGVDVHIFDGLDEAGAHEQTSAAVAHDRAGQYKFRRRLPSGRSIELRP